MSTQATHALKDNGPATVLYMALELSSKTWKVMFGGGGKQRTLDLPARDLPALMAAMGEAREKFGLPGDCKVASCYEAGRDGFWIHRALEAQKVENLVIDSSAIEVNRRAKKVKTDGIDVVKLLGLLRRYHGGDPKVFSVVRVPSREAEDDRHLMRELECLKGERTQHRNRIGSYLINLGLKIGKISGKTVKAEVAVLTDHAGLKVPAHTAAQIVREGQRLLLVEQQMLPLLKERRARERAARMALQAEAAAKAKSVHARSEPAATAGMAPVGQAMAVPAPASGTSQADTTALVVAKLMQLKSVGPETAWTLAQEFFGWRTFANRREVAAAAGLTPTPYASGDSRREQGLNKAGNRRVRAMMVEVSWMWQRHQPECELSAWYKRRFANGGGRARKVGIVGMARKLLIDLWRWVSFGVIPQGAVLKA